MNYIKSIILTTVFIAIINTCLFTQQGNEHKKKTEFEFSLGIGTIKPESIYTRVSGFDELISQYASLYQLNHSSSGTEAEFKNLIPFNVSANYFLGGQEFRWFLKAGITYGSKSINSTSTHQVTWPEFSETHAYDMTASISYLIPHIGIGVRYTNLDIYGTLGMGFTRFNYTEDYNYSEPGINSSTTTKFQIKETAPAVTFGIKYRIKLSSKKPGLCAFVKLESMILKLDSLSGSKITSGSNIGTQGSNGTIEGTIYNFQWNPYRKEWFGYWDLIESSVPESDLYSRSYSKMGLKLSGIRFMIGISF